MNNQEIVAKLWNLCNVLRDDGITYHQYVTELTKLYPGKWTWHFATTPDRRQRIRNMDKQST